MIPHNLLFLTFAESNNFRLLMVRLKNFENMNNEENCSEYQNWVVLFCFERDFQLSRKEACALK